MDATKAIGILLAAIMIATAMIPMVGAYVYLLPPAYQGSEAVPIGGNAVVNFSEIHETSMNWFGFFGNISSGNVTLGGDEHPFFQWSSWHNATDTAYVFATTNTSAPAWDNLSEVNATDIDEVWSFSAYDPDCANETFVNRSNTALYIRNSTYDADTTAAVRTLNGTRVDTWETAVLMTNGTTPTAAEYNPFLFVAVNDGPGGGTNTSFLGNPCDYQLLVPVNETAGPTQTYYLYLELRTSGVS